MLLMYVLKCYSCARGVMIFGCMVGNDMLDLSWIGFAMFGYDAWLTCEFTLWLMELVYAIWYWLVCNVMCYAYAWHLFCMVANL